MSEFLGYLERLKVRPNPDELTAEEKNSLNEHFDAYGSEVVVDGSAVAWRSIEEVEAVVAARSSGPAGWLVKQMMGGDRYHVGIYYGRQELVLSNITYNMAKYVVQTIAYYAPDPIRYKGIEGLSPIANA